MSEYLASLFSKHSGLPFTVWLMCDGGDGHEVHLKVSPSDNGQPGKMVSVAIRPDVKVTDGRLNAEELALLTEWVNLNRDVLVRYWDGDIDTQDALEALRRV